MFLKVTLVASHGTICPVLHILDINQLIFEYVHICMHVKVTMWPFYQNMENLPLLCMDSP